MSASPLTGLDARDVEPGQLVTISVPATVGNVGPGFDSVGLALDLRDELTVGTDPAAGPGLTVTVDGEGAGQVPTDETHLVVRTLRATLARTGYRAPALQLHARNVIPHGRGLGSSAAAIVSGALAADALLPEDQRWTTERLFQWCAHLEGHPDNVAPAVFGSLVISWQDDADSEQSTGAADAVRFRHAVVPVHPGIVPVMAIPDAVLSTEVSRGLLPPTVPHGSAAANAGRAALLTHAVSSDPALLVPATRDWLHQDARAAAMPASADLLHALRARGFAAVVSGAGPSILTLAADAAEADAVERAITELLADTDTAASWRVLRPGVGGDGARMKGHRD